MTEDELHTAIVEHINLRKAAGVMFYHVPNGEKRDAKTGAKLKRMGVQRGVSDLMGFVPDLNAMDSVIPLPHRAFALELKRPGAKPRREQQEWLQYVEQAGHFAGWADNLDTALRLLEAWGVIKPDAGRRVA